MLGVPFDCTGAELGKLPSPEVVEGLGLAVLPATEGADSLASTAASLGSTGATQGEHAPVRKKDGTEVGTAAASGKTANDGDGASEVGWQNGGCKVRGRARRRPHGGKFQTSSA